MDCGSESYSYKEFDQDAGFRGIAPNYELHRVRFNFLNVFYLEEGLVCFYVSDKVPEFPGEHVVGAWGEDRILSGVR